MAQTATEEPAHAPGSEQVLSCDDASTGERIVIHLWKDRASYDGCMFPEGHHR